MDVHNEAGATSIEYALMASLIAVVIATAVTGVGQAVLASFVNLADRMGW